MLQLIDRFAIEVDGVPKDLNTAGHVGDWYSLKNFRHITYIIAQGAWAASGTPAVTFDVATAVDGTGSTDWTGVTKKFSKVAGTGLFVEAAVVAGTFNLTVVDNTVTIVEIEANELPDGYDCIQMDIADPANALCFAAVLAILSGNRYPEALGGPDPKVD